MLRHSTVLVALFCAWTVAAEELPRIYLGSCPSVSGDGSRFAFEWNDRIWLAATTGGVARCVTPGPFKSVIPVMSADGRRIAFLSNREGCDENLFEADIETGRVRQLSYHSQQTCPSAWLPDGKGLLCVVARDHSGERCRRIAVLPTDRRADVRAIFDDEGFDPSLSPDGHTLLFRRRGDAPYRKRRHSKVTPEAGEIWSYDLRTGAFSQLVADRRDARNPVWAPDGRGFYYLHSDGGIRNVYFRSADADAAPQKLTDFTDDHVFQLSVSADGTTALFRQRFDFWRLDLKTPGARPVRIALAPEAGYQSRPPTRRRWYTATWNNDGDGCVAFTADGMQTAFTAGGDLYVMDTVMCEPQLVHGATLTHERDCAFTPDGQALYYMSDRGDGTDVWRAERADPTKAWWENRTFVKTRVVSDGETRRGFSLSPDGKAMAWMGAEGRLAFAGTNGAVRARGPKTTRGGTYSWSPDGRFVAAQISNRNIQNDVFIVSTEEDEKAWPLTCNYLFDGYPTWSPDGQVIAWLSVRPDVADGDLLAYVYLDEAAEERELLFTKLEEARKKTAEKKPEDKKETKDADKEKAEKPDGDKPEKEAEQKPEPEKRPVPFEKLIDRVRVTTVRIGRPFFADDSRTLAFASGNVTKSVRLPNEMSPKQAFGKTGRYCRWTKKDGDGGKMLWATDNKPAHGDTAFGFTVYQTTDVADYQELAFRTAWGRIRDTYYDAACHGEDWPAIRDKYLPYARNAGSVSVFTRIMRMMLGELDSSHLHFGSTKLSEKEWEPKAPVHGWNVETRHLGIRFDAAHRGAGWKIRDVIKDSPADRREYGLKPGDVVTHVDGTAVMADTDPAEVLNGPSGKKATITVGGREIRIDTIGYDEARRLLTEAALDANRELVHARSGGRFGYLNIAKMDNASLERFRHEAYVEGFGRDGLVIDVRANRGGHTADRMMTTLFGAMHNYWSARGIDLEYFLGYSERPLWYKPIVVLCSEETASNAEIFSHGVQQLGRGRLVGRETGGAVIAKQSCDVLDYGTMSDAHLGVFLLDGRDMEYNGAKPDVAVDDLPADRTKGVDRQLETAIGVLEEDVKAWKRRHPPVVPAYAR